MRPALLAVLVGLVLCADVGTASTPQLPQARAYSTTGTAAGCDGDAPSPAPGPPLAAGPCSPVQPGSPLFAKLGDASASCVLGFFYRDRRGTTYATTGPDCAPPFNFDHGPTTWAPGRGPAALAGRNGPRIGEFAFRFSTDDRLGIALVRLDSRVIVNPQVCHYGGPTGVTGEVSTVPRTVVMVGPQGDAFPEIGSVTRPGAAVHGLNGSRGVLVLSESMVESGMPVMTEDGLAIGNADWYSFRFNGISPEFGLPVTRPIHWLPAANQALRTNLTLLTAALR